MPARCASLICPGVAAPMATLPGEAPAKAIACGQAAKPEIPNEPAQWLVAMLGVALIDLG
jgi:hypothetical protein